MGNLTLVLKDDGGTANGGVDTSTAYSFTITITPINDLPTLAPIDDLSLLEDAGTQTVSLSGLSSGPADESGQGLTVTAVSDNAALIPSPSVSYSSPNASSSLTFTPGASQKIQGSADAVTVSGWATGFSPGQANEAGQSLLGYQVVINSNPALFAAAPIIAVDGTLSYTPKPGASGTAMLGVVARDSGGTASGGVDTSKVYTFTITVGRKNSVYLPVAAR